MFGNPETTTGGRALKFYSSIRIDVRRIDSIKQGDEIIGNRTRAKIVKNKVAPPFRQCEFDIMYGQGISKVGELVDLAANIDVIKKSGSWYSYNDNKLGQGRENVKAYFLENKDIMDEVEKKVRDFYDKSNSLEFVPEKEDEEKELSAE